MLIRLVRFLLLLEILLEKASKAHDKMILYINKLHIFDVRGKTHEKLNNLKGMINCLDTLNCILDKIIEELKS